MLDDNKISADIFYDHWDFLFWLQLKGKINPVNHSYILNSLSLKNEVCRKIIAFKNFIKYAFLFMPNDEMEYQTTHDIAYILEAEDIQVGSIEQFYNGFLNISDFRLNKPLG